MRPLPFILIHSPKHTVRKGNLRKLRKGDKLGVVTAFFTRLYGHVNSPEEVIHRVSFFGLMLPLYRTTVYCRANHCELTTYNLIYNRVFYIPAQVFIALNLVGILLSSVFFTVGLLFGLTGMTIEQFLFMVSLFLVSAVAFVLALFLLKLVTEFFSRPHFRVIRKSIIDKIS